MVGAVQVSISPSFAANKAPWDPVNQASSSNTSIRSARRKVDKRCAAITTVLPGTDILQVVVNDPFRTRSV